ncbi:hypothetical protein ZHAS_00010589 [Anopheles sinensis]|uniref:Uncharacterized protein n=1 Tax=Anopheles sinensis TaxID=74873 RepID=A0A084VXZ5_ANOSI|nr:hypothetical protein ZHAS_00010589 [Anopheles sinensis]
MSVDGPEQEEGVGIKLPCEEPPIRMYRKTDIIQCGIKYSQASCRQTSIQSAKPKVKGRPKGPRKTKAQQANGAKGLYMWICVD